jgi:cytochrome d ubiquinol oxidase subunit I
MQHPVGYVLNPDTNRAELVDFGAVLFQNTTYTTFLHTIVSCFLVSGAMVVGVSLWLMMRGKSVDAMRKTLTLGLITVFIAGLGTIVTGDMQAKIMVQQQPMKIAAAEGLFETTTKAPFSLFTVGPIDGSEATFSISIPGLLSFMATGDWNGEVQGINDLQAQSEAKFGPGEYAPYVPLVFWAFRAMIGLGMVAVLFALVVWWRTRKSKPLPTSRFMAWAAATVTLFPLFGISAGWIFTEMGRQPWIVFGLMKTENGVSPTLGTTAAWISIVTFTLLYGALAVIEVGLIIRQVKIGPPETVELVDADDTNAGQPLTFSY